MTCTKVVIFYLYKATALSDRSCLVSKKEEGSELEDGAQQGLELQGFWSVTVEVTLGRTATVKSVMTKEKTDLSWL